MSSIEVNSSGYLLQRDDGSQSLLLHHELQTVDILHEDEVYFLLIGPNSSLVIPQATVGIDALLVSLQKLPDFDHHLVVEVMNAPGRVTCWQRGPSPPPVVVQISVHPDICQGKPHLEGTQITVSDILGLLASDCSHQHVLASYPDLTPAAITAALHYAARQVDLDDTPPPPDLV